MNYTPELDRWYLWMVVKSWDMPYHQVVQTLSRLDIPVYAEENNKQYISKTDFKNFLSSID